MFRNDWKCKYTLCSLKDKSLANLLLTHWGQAAYNTSLSLAIIASDNGLSLVRRQAIIRNSAALLWSGPLGTRFSEILSKYNNFHTRKWIISKIAVSLSSVPCVQWHQTITRTNFDFSVLGFCGFHLRAISEWIPKLLYCILSLKIIVLKLLPRLPGANELNTFLKLKTKKSSMIYIPIRWEGLS